MINKEFKLIVSSALKLLEGASAAEHNLDQPLDIRLSDNIVLQIQNDPYDFVTLTCLIDVDCRDLSASALWDILQTNLLRAEYPPIVTSGLSDDKGIVIWARDHLLQMNAVKLYDLIIRLHHHAKGVEAWLRKTQSEKQHETKADIRFVKPRQVINKVL